MLCTLKRANVSPKPEMRSIGSLFYRFYFGPKLKSVNFLELERQRIDHERRSASSFRSLPQRRRKNLKSIEDLKGEIQHKEMLRLLRNFNEKFIGKIGFSNIRLISDIEYYVHY